MNLASMEVSYFSYVFKLGIILNELKKQLLNSAFVSYEELWRSRRVTIILYKILSLIH